MLLKSMLFSAVLTAVITIDQSALVPIGTVLTISGGIWWMGRKLQKIDDRLDDGDTRFSRIEVNMKERDEMLRSIERKVDRLPCVDRGDCQEERKGKK
jgi:hypothetical protein